MSEATISAKGLMKTYGKLVAVDGVDLDIPPGCVFGLMGRNGAGKSSLIRMLLGLTPVTKGAATVFGFDCARKHVEIRRRAGPEKFRDEEDGGDEPDRREAHEREGFCDGFRRRPIPRAGSASQALLPPPVDLVSIGEDPGPRSPLDPADGKAEGFLPAVACPFIASEVGRDLLPGAQEPSRSLFFGHGMKLYIG